ncbi:hypothetical protein OIE13_22595 [Streptosporangium sp. NBC_01810]|uniref:hypothetical protein n=1 Tax=Streptosporangium sp. NBC_01810 TaxID=2975951 RepID=UPI002DD9016C|nr:hypothetical protein [Streptosporangium sp. NBC_01810]WSA23734.1 hypothetical protein OIE13_22595 [Streptosporangium sp. NBC_01810]
MSTKRHLADLLPEPADGTVLVIRVGDTYGVIQRDDATASQWSEDVAERWLNASDVDSDPLEWRVALEYVDEVFPLGVALASPVSDASGEPPVMP